MATITAKHAAEQQKRLEASAAALLKEHEYRKKLQQNQEVELAAINGKAAMEQQKRLQASAAALLKEHE